MYFYTWEKLKMDPLLLSEFYIIIYNQLLRKKPFTNVTNELVDVLKLYDVEDENDIHIFIKYMPDDFKNKIKQLIKNENLHYTDIENTKFKHTLFDF